MHQQHSYIIYLQSFISPNTWELLHTIVQVYHI